MPRRVFQIVPRENVAVLPLSATVHDAAAVMARRRQCAVLIMTANRLDGILTEQDVVRRVVAEGRNPDTVTVAEVMTPRPDTIEQEESALSGLRMMEDGHYRHLPVVRDGCVVCLISRLDFIGEEKAEIESERHLQETIW